MVNLEGISWVMAFMMGSIGEETETVVAKGEEVSRARKEIVIKWYEAKEVEKRRWLRAWKKLT